MLPDKRLIRLDIAMLRPFDELGIRQRPVLQGAIVMVYYTAADLTVPAG
jgi:hypothetical protein